jgi:hypothetical protein
LFNIGKQATQVQILNEEVIYFVLKTNQETIETYLTHGGFQTLLQCSWVTIGNGIANASKLSSQIEASGEATCFWELRDDG